MIVGARHGVDGVGHDVHFPSGVLGSTGCPLGDPGGGAAVDGVGVEAVVAEHVGHRRAAAAGLADEEHRTGPVDLGQPVDQLPHRDARGARHVAGDELRRLADVDHLRRTDGLRGSEVSRGDSATWVHSLRFIYPGGYYES